MESNFDSTERELEKTSSKFNFKLYFGLLFLLVGAVGGINWLVDPLWYGKGNKLTGRNFAFNERISKTNQFLKNKENYDCIILGSSRVIALKASNFKENNCFNYSLKGGEIPDFVDYVNYLKESGFNPKKVYIGVDGLNFVAKERKERKEFDINTVKTKSFYHAYFSTDILSFSLMTLLGLSPDPGNYYDSNLEPVDFTNAPAYKANFYDPLYPQECDRSTIKDFKNIREAFPNAEFISYIPPRSAWSMINDTYGRDLMDCYLENFYEISKIYDVTYDFTIPNEVTKDPSNTFDGSHYSVTVNNKIADILQGKPQNFGVKINDYSYEEYREKYLGELKEFLAENGELKRWKND